MKNSLLIALTSAALLGASGVTARAQIINEVYAGGGSTAAGTTYTRDFVELYNPGPLSVSLAGYTLQYASATGVFSNTIVLFGPGTVIGANSYLSVATGSIGTAGATLTVGTGAGFVNYVVPGGGGASLSNTGGSVRLYDTNFSTTVDVVGYGSATQGSSPATDPKFETAVAPAPTSTATSLGRTGFADTGSNAADFTNMTPSPFASATSVVVVPEPATYAFVIAGLGGLGLVLRRRRTSI